MTTNIAVLNDTLRRRIAHGTAGAKDLSLLQQLLLCERRRYLALGAMSGVCLAAVAQLMVAMALW